MSVVLSVVQSGEAFVQESVVHTVGGAGGVGIDVGGMVGGGVGAGVRTVDGDGGLLRVCFLRCVTARR
jgi:hypothetical protein